MELTGTLITGIDVRGTAAADELLMIAQTEQAVGCHLTDTTLAQTRWRAEHSFWARLRLRHVTGVSSVPRCVNALYTSNNYCRHEICVICIIFLIVIFIYATADEADAYMFYRCFCLFFFRFFPSVTKIPDNRSRERLNGFSWNFYQTIAGKV